MATAVKKSRAQEKMRLFHMASGFDVPFLIILLVLLTIGLACMFSASYAYAYYWNDDSYYYIKRQL